MHCLLPQTRQTDFSSFQLEYFFRYKTSMGSSISEDAHALQTLPCFRPLEGKQHLAMNLSEWKTWTVSHSDSTF